MKLGNEINFSGMIPVTPLLSEVSLSSPHLEMMQCAWSLATFGLISLLQNTVARDFPCR